MTRIVYEGDDLQKVELSLKTKKDEQEQTRQQRHRERAKEKGFAELTVTTSDRADVRETIHQIARHLKAKPEDALTWTEAIKSGPLHLSLSEARSASFPCLEEPLRRLTDPQTRSDEETVQALAARLRSRIDLRTAVEAAEKAGIPVVREDRSEEVLTRIEQLTSLVTSLGTALKAPTLKPSGRPTKEDGQEEEAGNRFHELNSALVEKHVSEPALRCLTDLLRKDRMEVQDRQHIGRSLAELFPPPLASWLHLWVSSREYARPLLGYSVNAANRREIEQVLGSELSLKIISRPSKVETDRPGDVDSLKKAIVELLAKPAFAGVVSAMMGSVVSEAEVELLRQNAKAMSLVVEVFSRVASSLSRSSEVDPDWESVQSAIAQLLSTRGLAEAVSLLASSSAPPELLASLLRDPDAIELALEIARSGTSRRALLGVLLGRIWNPHAARKFPSLAT